MVKGAKGRLKRCLRNASSAKGRGKCLGAFAKSRSRKGRRRK